MTQTTVLKKNSTNGGYDFIEYSTETRQFVTGNTGSYQGHSSYKFKIDVASKKVIKEMEKELRSLGYQEIEKF